MSMPMANAEESLIVAAQRGSLQAFNQLVLTYQPLAYNVAYHLLGETDAAVDATQDSFIKAYRALFRFKGGSFKAWLLRIVTNTCYDRLRSRHRLAARVFSLDGLPAQADSFAWLADRRAGPGEQAERHELRQALRRGIHTLPPEQATVIVLYDLEGFSYEEISQATGMPMGTVKSRLSRARTHLRDYMQVNWFGQGISSRPCSLA